MRTTVDIDDDVLLAARALARLEAKTVGSVLSELARRGLFAPPATAEHTTHESFFGFHPWPRRDRPVTNELINRLRGDGPY